MKIKNITFCEDIRYENGGKFSLMGIFGDSARIHLPAEAPEKVPFHLAFLVTLENVSQEYKKIILSAEIITNDETVGPINAHVELKGADTIVHIPFPMFSTELSESRDVTLKAKVLAEGVLVTEGDATLHILVHRQEATAG